MGTPASSSRLMSLQAGPLSSLGLAAGSQIEGCPWQD